MFDLTSSKLLILAVVALLVVGPKDLPALLRTVGRYLGMIRRQAEEFRAQFDEAMRESELADIKKEVEKIGADTTATFQEATQSIDKDIGTINQQLETAMADAGSTSAGSTSDAGAVAGYEPGLIGSDVAIAEAPAELAPPQPPVAAPARPVVERALAADAASTPRSAG